MSRKQYEKDFDRLLKWIGQYSDMYAILNDQFGRNLRGFPEFDDLLAFLELASSVVAYPYDYTSDNCDIMEQCYNQNLKIVSPEAQEGFLRFCQVLANSIVHRDDPFT